MSASPLMPYQDKARLIFDYLITKLPSSSIGHKWDDRLKAENFFVYYKKKLIGVFVPKAFFESIRASDIEAKLEDFRLINCIQQNGKNPIVVTNSGLSFETKRKGPADRRKIQIPVTNDRRIGKTDRRNRISP
jgi:hypothetical protein